MMTTMANRPRIGLVLGGGGAKGAAEVGALKAIEECGIHVDYIAGTSIGAIVGSLYAAGYTSAEIEQLFCEQEWMSLLTDRRDDLSGEPVVKDDGIIYVFGFPVIDTENRSFGVLRGGRVEQVIDSLLAAHNAVEFSTLKTPFSCVAAEIKTASEVVLSEGTVPQAVRASMAIPGIFKPEVIDGRSLVDGGMMNNLPVDVVREMGADIVIAIDLQQNKHESKQPRENLLTTVGDLLGLGDMIQWIINRPDITKYNNNRQAADIYINPSLPDYEASSFGNEKIKRMIQIGYEAACAQKEQLMKLVKQEFSY